jgi:RNA 3'-terminal phosphate cyclase
VGVDLWANFSSGAILGAGTVLGERGVSSEKVGQIAATKLQDVLQSDATIDEYASDQIVPFIYVVNKPSRFIVPSISSHLRTNLMILEQIFHHSCSITSVPRGFMINYETKTE